MPQVFYKDGKPVPDAKIADAVASGEAFAKEKRVKVKDANGVVGTIDASELGHPGYQVLSDQEIERERIHQERTTPGQFALTAVEGGLRGPSLGASDVIAGGLLGPKYTKGAQEREQENNKLAVGSEIAGTIAATALTGGGAGAVRGAAGAAELAGEASTLGKVARLIPSNLVAGAGNVAERAAARVVGSGAESALGRMAQRAAAVGAQGAAEGGLYGVGHEVSQATLNDTPITAEKLLSGFGHGALFGGAAGAGLGAAGSLATSALGKIVGSGGAREAAETVANKSALEAVGVGKSDLESIGARTGRSADAVVADAGPELLNYQFESGPLKGKKLFSGARRAEDFVDDIALAKQEVGAKVAGARQAAEAAGVAPDLQSALGRVQSEVLDPLRLSNSPAIRKQAEQIESELSILRQRSEGKILDAAGMPLPPPGLADLERVGQDFRATLPAKAAAPVTKILDQEIDAAVAKHFQAQGLDPAEYVKAQKSLAALTDIDEVAQRAAASKGASKNPADYATGLSMALGAMMTGNVGGLALGAASSFARKLIKERGQSVLAVMADNVARMDGRIAEAAGVLAGAPRRAAAIAATTPDVSRFDDTAEAVRAFAQDPAAAQERLSKPVEHIAPLHPQLAAQMQATLAGDYQYLAGQLPAVMTRADNSLTPQLETGRVPASQQAKFMGIVHALENPASVIEKIAAGELPQAQIDALKIRRPEIYNQMRTEAIKAFSTTEKPASFLERTRVSLAFDFNGDASLDPQTLKAIQAGNRNAPREPDQPATVQPQQQQQARPSKLDPKISQEMVTPSQAAQASGA